MIIFLASLFENVFYGIEFTIVVLVILYQIVHSLVLYGSIRRLRNIFSNPFSIKTTNINRHKTGTVEDVLSETSYSEENESNDVVDNLSIKITLVDTLGTNEVILRIKKTLNSYLLNNHGAVVNFSIIKDIFDREVDVKDDEISQSITTPLYLGLAATMIGIIFGLLAMPELKSVSVGLSNGVAEIQFQQGINALINGVKLAMIASLTGLLCTTLLSSFSYKKAKRIVTRDKNDQLSYLQAKLLPELVKAEDTGASGLKASLDRFAREATKISDNMRITASQSAVNIQAQLDVISKVETLNMTKVSKANLNMFDRLESNMDTFNEFSNYLNLMSKISENLSIFSTRTDNVEIIANEIKSTLKKSNELSEFLSIHFQQIQAVGSSALEAVDLTDSHFREAINLLGDETNARISSLYKVSDDTESAIKETFDNIGDKLNDIVQVHLNSLTVAYNESTPHFDQLDNLKLIPEINERSTNQSKELIEAINQLNISLKSINNRIDNQSVLSKLDSIEKSLSRKSTIGRSDPSFPKNKDPKKTFYTSLKNSFTKLTKSLSNEKK